MSDIWEAKVAENVQRELTNMHPRIAAYLKKLVKEEANNDWGQALALMDMVHKELLEVKAQLQNMGKGAVPPSHSVQNLVARLEALEQDHAQLKTDVRLLQALTTKTERLAALEVMTQSCVRASGEIQANIHALVEAANLRCLENSIRQHQLQLLKKRSTGVLVECGSVIREILHAVDRVNV